MVPWKWFSSQTNKPPQTLSTPVQNLCSSNRVCKPVKVCVFFCILSFFGAFLTNWHNNCKNWQKPYNWTAKKPTKLRKTTKTNAFRRTTDNRPKRKNHNLTASFQPKTVKNRTNIKSLIPINPKSNLRTKSYVLTYSHVSALRNFRPHVRVVTAAVRLRSVNIEFHSSQLSWFYNLFRNCVERWIKPDIEAKVGI